MLVLLSIMAASFAKTIQREISLAGNTRNLAQATAIAEAGVHYAMLMLLPNDPMQKWRADGTVYDISLAGAQVRVQVQDEMGKFDLNTADEPLLRNLLKSIGLDEDEAIQITDAIADWRDGDDLKRLSGAEKEDYRAAGLAYGPTDQAFQSVEELQMVLGVSPETYQKLEALVTVHSGQKGIDPTKASEEALKALPNVDEQMIEDYLEARAESVANKSPAPPFPSLPGVSIAGGGNLTYTIQAEAKLPDGVSARVRAIVKRQIGQANRPFTIIDWKQPLPVQNSLSRDPQQSPS